MTDRLSYSVAEAARVVGVSPDTIRKAINATENYLPARRVGTKRLILAADLAAWLDALPSA